MSVKSDVLVIGGGTMGTAAGWALARRGQSVTILEQFDHYHGRGSHSGNTRIYRHAYAEGAHYGSWAIESTNLWSALQERSATTLMIPTGYLDISKPGLTRANDARDSAQKFDLPIEELTGRDLNERWQAWNAPADWVATLDPNAGILLVEESFRVFAREFTEAGGTLRTNETVTSWEATADSVRVVTDQDSYEADSLIVAAGAWSGKVLAELGIPLEVRRKPVMWFETETEAPFRPENFPGFVYQDSANDFYGLPSYGEDSVKIGIHSGGDVVDPDTIDREWHDSDIKSDFRKFLTERLNGVRVKLTNSSVCMYVMTPDEDFIIDRHPEHANVALAAGFSGHGFKFTPKVGEHLADLITGVGDPVPEFSLSRFGILS